MWVVNYKSLMACDRTRPLRATTLATVTVISLGDDGIVLVVISTGQFLRPWEDKRPLARQQFGLINTQFCVTLSVRATVLSKGLEIERTHKRPGSFERKSAECCLFNLGEILIYLAAAQGFPLPREVGNYHTKDGVNNAPPLITMQGRGSTKTSRMF